MSWDEILEAFSKPQGMTGGPKKQTQEALHRPLLVLFALSRWLRRGQTLFAFEEVQEPLGELLREFVHAGSASLDPRSPFWPFWNLTHDGVWHVKTPEGADINFTGKEPTPKMLLEQQAQGRFADHVMRHLRSSPGRAVELIGRVLHSHFLDPSTHPNLLRRLGLWCQTEPGS